MARAEIGQDNSGNTRILVETTFREKSLIVQVPGAKYDGELKKWKVPLSYAGCMVLSSVFGQAIEVSDELKQYAADRANNAEFLTKIKGRTFDEEDVRGGTLMALQTQGVEFLMASGSAILADDMGSGKTVQVSAVLEKMSERPALHLVVCPKSVKGTWKKHIDQWTSMTPAVIAGGAKARREQIAEAVELSKTEAVVLIANWDLLREHSRLKGYGNTRLSEKDRTKKELNDLEFDYVIGDEAHRMISPKSKWTRAMWYLGGQAKHRVLLTGTPIANNPGDLWSLLHFVDPVEWPAKGPYVDRWCATQYSPYGYGNIITGLNHATKDEFYHLLDRYFLRRKKEEIMGRTIEVIPEVRTVTLPPKHRKMYNDMRDEFVARIDMGVVSATNPLAQTGRLAQLCAAPLEQGKQDRDGNPTYKMVGPSPKVAEMMNVLDDLGPDEPVIIWSSSNQLLHLAKDAVDKHNAKSNAKPIRYSFVDGAVIDSDREEQIDKFQSGQTTVFFAMTSAISEGVTLTAARYAVYLQRPWSMIENLQSEKRNDRMGQEADSVTIIDIVAEDTIDEHIHAVYGEKTIRLDEITRDSIKEML